MRHVGDKPISSDSNLEYAPLAAMLVRLFWMAFGLVTLASIAGALWSRSDASALWSVAYWLNVALIVGARYVDIRYYRGETVNLEPANLGHWRRHTAVLVPLALALWVAALWTGR